jgi:hypothetical protein
MAKRQQVTDVLVKPVYLVQATINGKLAPLDSDGFGRTWTILTNKAQADHFAAELMTGNAETATDE